MYISQSIHQSIHLSISLSLSLSLALSLSLYLLPFKAKQQTQQRLIISTTFASTLPLLACRTSPNKPLSNMARISMGKSWDNKGNILDKWT
jgi:hypothetical protein